ncbi:hypothetical protein T439DRAFT_247614 [Meredithblackwellia eburnea MCA 4105]
MVEPTTLTQGALPSLVLFGTESEGLDIDIVSSVLIDEYNAPSFAYTQKAVPYTINVMAGNSSISLSSLGSDPLGTISTLLSSLKGITTCINGGTGLSIISSLLGDVTSLLGDLSLLPGFILSLIEGIPTAVPSVVSSLVSGVVSDVSSLTSGVGSVVSSLTSEVGGAVSSVVSQGEGVVTSVIGDVTSIVPLVASSPAAAATTAVAAVTSAAGAAVTPVVSAATSAVGALVSGLVGRGEFPQILPWLRSAHY